jgi:hypothetical protein
MGAPRIHGEPAANEVDIVLERDDGAGSYGMNGSFGVN